MGEAFLRHIHMRLKAQRNYAMICRAVLADFPGGWTAGDHEKGREHYEMEEIHTDHHHGGGGSGRQYAGRPGDRRGGDRGSGPADGAGYEGDVHRYLAKAPAG